MVVLGSSSLKILYLVAQNYFYTPLKRRTEVILKKGEVLHSLENDRAG